MSLSMYLELLGHLMLMSRYTVLKLLHFEPNYLDLIESIMYYMIIIFITDAHAVTPKDIPRFGDPLGGHTGLSIYLYLCLWFTTAKAYKKILTKGKGTLGKVQREPDATSNSPLPTESYGTHLVCQNGL